MQEKTVKREAIYLAEKVIDLAVQDDDRDFAMDIESVLDLIKSGKFDSDKDKLYFYIESFKRMIASYEEVRVQKERYKKLTRRANFNLALLWVVGIVGIAAMAWYAYSFTK